MRKFAKEEANKILLNELPTEIMFNKYPELRNMVLDDISKFTGVNSNDINIFINRYKGKASFAINKIKESKENQNTLNAYLPEIIKARMVIHYIEALNLAALSGKVSKRVRLNLWDGIILQRILFKKDFERKPVSLFWFKLFWPFIINKKILMSLVQKKGIYCFYSKALLREISSLIDKSKCIEIAAGDGTLTRFLNELGVSCIATDDYSWRHYIQYPDFVEKIDAKKALLKYQPETVICSWTPPENSFEKYIFQMNSVKLYIVIGTRNSLFSGNHYIYQNQKNFTMDYNQRLSELILPPSNDNAVFVFRRKSV